MDDITGILLETFPTKNIHDGHINGKLNVIWRDWDNILKSHPKMVYVSHVNPYEIKGPHLHTKASPAWRPNDDEMKNVTFDDYDWKKWKKAVKNG